MGFQLSWKLHLRGEALHMLLLQVAYEPPRGEARSVQLCWMAFASDL